MTPSHSMESYNPNKLAHQEPVFPVSEWMEYNDLENERDWRTEDSAGPSSIWRLVRDEMKDSIWEDINKGDKSPLDPLKNPA